MTSRMFKGFALMGAFLALEGFAKECKGVALYSDGRDGGQMIQTGMTFPEPPEWKTNWGYLDGMEPPYIRLSGMKNVQGDWKGLLSFPALPLYVDDGVLRLKVRVTQNVSFGIWLTDGSKNSKVHYVNLAANVTQPLEIALSSFGVNSGMNVANVGVGLFNVPQYQYTTLFIDDVGFSCVSTSPDPASGTVTAGSQGTVGAMEYAFSNVEPWSEIRESRFLPTLETEYSAAYSEQKRSELLSRTDADFVVSELEHLKVADVVLAAEMTAKKSRLQWYDNLYTIVRNRLREKVVANPKQVYFEAEAIAAESDYTVIPLLVADLDYSYSACMDSLCRSTQIVNAHLLTAGLPTSFVRGSKMSLLLDPYFIVTRRKELPAISVCVSGTCKSIAPKERIELEFPSTGTQKLVVKMISNGRNVEQNLFVEVR